MTASGDTAIAQVMKTFHTTHGGKLSLARVLDGQAAGRVDRLWPGRPGRADRRAVLR